MPSNYCRPIVFFNDTATPEIYTLSLHDALPICAAGVGRNAASHEHLDEARLLGGEDRKSTRLNSSHSQISYAVFCLKKKTGYGFLRCGLHPAFLLPDTAPWLPFSSCVLTLLALS